MHPLFMAQVTVALAAETSAAGTWDLFLFPAVEHGYEISAGVFAMKPASRGRVTLTSSDPAAPPAIDHGFLSDKRDVDVLAFGVEAARDLAAGEACARYARREIRPGEAVDAVEHVRATARGFFHPVGTCAMGHVVDDRGRVLGLNGIAVADARSCRPSRARTPT